MNGPARDPGRFVRVNGADLWVVEAGSGEPIILTLHGGPGIGSYKDNHGMFGPMEDEFRFVHYDQRGNGRSPGTDPETYSHDLWIEDAEALRRTLGLGKVALSGGSYGGILAMEYALKYPEAIHSMVLRGTAASYELQQSAFTNALAADLPGVDRPLLEKLFLGRMASDEDLRDSFVQIYPLYSRSYDPSKLQALMDKVIWHHRTHNKFFQDIFPTYDIRERLGEIRMPVLILAGRHDWITPLKFAQELADGMPAAELVIFENAGHSINADEPDLFKQTIREFLRRFR